MSHADRIRVIDGRPTETYLIGAVIIDRGKAGDCRSGQATSVVRRLAARVLPPYTSIIATPSRQCPVITISRVRNCDV